MALLNLTQLRLPLPALIQSTGRTRLALRWPLQRRMAGAPVTEASGADSGAVTTWAALSERYNGFIFDQFGVMHNGSVALPGAPELISWLHEMGKRLVILSNSSKRANWSMRELSKLGIDAAAFVGAVTSGEEAWRALRDEWAGRRCLWLAKKDSSGVTDYLDGTGVSLAPVEDADMILCAGTNTIRDGVSIQEVDCETTGNIESYRSRALDPKTHASRHLVNARGVLREAAQGTFRGLLALAGAGARPGCACWRLDAPRRLRRCQGIRARHLRGWRYRA